MREAATQLGSNTPLGSAGAAPGRLLGEGSAGGKVILLGEHAVVYGHPAVAVGLDRGVTVRVEEAQDGPRLDAPHWNVAVPLTDAEGARPLSIALERVRKAVAPQLTRFVLRADDRLPLGAGLGSSAALTVAVARALSAAVGVPLTTATLMDVVQRAEQVFHGNPSGVDQACVVHGGLIRFQRNAQAPHRVEPIALARPVTLVVALMRAHWGTKEAVEALRQRRERQPRTVNLLMAELGALATDGVAALNAGDLAALGEQMDLAHGILHALGVSSDDLDILVRQGRALGALGAKLTGAGVGGATVMVTDGDPERTRRVVLGLRAHGAQAFSMVVQRSSMGGVQ